MSVFGFDSNSYGKIIKSGNLIKQYFVKNDGRWWRCKSGKKKDDYTVLTHTHTHTHTHTYTQMEMLDVINFMAHGVL